MRLFETTITPEQSGWTVEQVLRRSLRLSVTRIKRAKFREDGILLDGVRVFTTARVSEGQHLTVRLPEQETTTLLETPGSAQILYEDEWLFLVDKPAGVPVHPGPGHYADTLGNFLTWYFAQRGETLVFRPVNRLDKGTSGLLVVAKSAQAHERLQRLLHTRDFCREYLALTECAPEPPSGRICKPIGPIPGEKNRYQVCPEGKPAVTDYETLQTSFEAALLRLRLHTGRTHQIRVHLSSLGCPLLGDTAYGGQPVLDYPALHSWRITLRHPFSGKEICVTAPLPQWIGDFGMEMP